MSHSNFEGNGNFTRNFIEGQATCDNLSDNPQVNIQAYVKV